MYCDSGICYSSYTISDKKYKEKKKSVLSFVKIQHGL